MKTDQQLEPVVFLQTVLAAMAQLKRRLQQDYEQAYPGLDEVIHLVLDEEETRAWKLSAFPHLLLSDLVETHISRLGLRPVETRHDDVLLPRRFPALPTYQPTLALCA